MTRRYLILLFLLLQTKLFALTTGDTIHISHYEISIDTINYSTKSIRARTVANVHIKTNNVNIISLSLLHFTIDSIVTGTQNLIWTYTDTILRITLPTAMNTADSLLIGIYYHGQPQGDPSGWGGFYFNGNYAFNLGVGFDANPHVFGRAWFACVDEFTDKALYDFHITTPDTYKAFCNGILQNETDNLNGTKTWDWKMTGLIPTYLASVAVAPFYTIVRSYNGIPCEMAVLANDTTATLVSFGNLGTAVNTFITDFGAYPWDKIGYVMTPEIYGGMEHATSIHISKTYVDGTKNYETLFFHELSHMWWGDHVTCKTPEDMWLNEGFATFCEHIFTEAQYGTDAYKTSFHTDHLDVLRHAHIDDSTYLALNNVPFKYTYAPLSVYKKGALTGHTLRKYMGDDLFFAGCRNYQQNHTYANATSDDLRDDLSSSSGINMTDFFDDWVKTPGFPAFTIDSTSTLQNGSMFDVTIYSRQKQKGNTHTYKMKVEFNFTDGSNDSNIVFLCDAPTNVFHATLNFNPTWISVDRNEKMMDAITDFEQIISSTGYLNTYDPYFKPNVQAVGSPATTVRLEHIWVSPDTYKFNPGIRVSATHYWKVDGIFNSGFYSKATILYDGNYGSGYLDKALISGVEDSLVVLYRRSTADDWIVVNGYSLNMGNHNDKTGTIVIDTLKKGEYVLGYRDYSVRGISKKDVLDNILLSASPNPSRSDFQISFASERQEKGILKIISIDGKELLTEKILPLQRSFSWNTSGIPAGIYFGRFETSKGNSAFVKMVLIR